MPVQIIYKVPVKHASLFQEYSILDEIKSQLSAT